MVWDMACSGGCPWAESVSWNEPGIVRRFGALAGAWRVAGSKHASAHVGQAQAAMFFAVNHRVYGSRRMSEDGFMRCDEA